MADTASPGMGDAARLRTMAPLLGLPAERRSGGGALRRLLELTDENLGRRLQIRVERGYADVRKDDHGRRPHSLYVATAQGRAAFAVHVAGRDARLCGPPPAESAAFLRQSLLHSSGPIITEEPTRL